MGFHVQYQLKESFSNNPLVHERSIFLMQLGTSGKTAEQVLRSLNSGVDAMQSWVTRDLGSGKEVGTGTRYVTGLRATSSVFSGTEDRWAPVMSLL